MDDLTTRAAKLLWAKLPAPHTCPDEIDAAARALVALVLDEAAKEAVALTAERDALRAKLDVAKREILNASLFAAELAESIRPSEEWSHVFNEGYIFGGRDAARMIRQKCTFPDADIARKPHPQ